MVFLGIPILTNFQLLWIFAAAEAQKELVIPQPHAVVHPGAMMIHPWAPAAFREEAPKTAPKKKHQFIWAD